MRVEDIDLTKNNFFVPEVSSEEAALICGGYTTTLNANGTVTLSTVSGYVTFSPTSSPAVIHANPKQGG